MFHVLNRAVAREKTSWKPADYGAFESVLQKAGERLPMRLLCYCVLSNHRHLVLRPRGDEDLSEYLRCVTVTLAKCWHAQSHSSGSGAPQQGRFKVFAIQEDGDFLTVCRYVDSNPLRAKLVERAEAWRRCSLFHRVQGSNVVFLDAWPVRAGKTMGELRDLTAQQMLQGLEIPLTPRRMQCGLLAFKVLKTIVYSLDSTVRPEER